MSEVSKGLRYFLLVGVLWPCIWSKKYASFHLNENQIRPLPSPPGVSPHYAQAFTPLPLIHWDVAVDDMRANMVYLLDTTIHPPRHYPIRLTGNRCQDHDPSYTLKSGDFDGDGVADLAVIGCDNLWLIHLRDDPDRPITGAVTVVPRALPGFAEQIRARWVSFAEPMVAVGDLDRNGVDDLIVGVRYGTDQLLLRPEGGSFDKALVVLFLQASFDQPVMRAARLEGVGFDDVLPSLTPDTLTNIGDVNNDQRPEVLAVSESGEEGAISYAVLSLKEYGEPVNTNYRVQLDDYADYWASYDVESVRGDKNGSIYRYQGHGIDEDPRHRFGVTLSKKEVRKVYNLGDLDGDGLPELGVPLPNLPSNQGYGSVLILSPRKPDYSDTVATPGIPILSTTSHRMARLRDIHPSSMIPATPISSSTPPDARFSRLMMRRDDPTTKESSLVVVSLPFPLTASSLPVKEWEEPILVVFNPTYLVLDFITLLCSVAGLVMAGLLMYRCVMTGRAGWRSFSLSSETQVPHKGPFVIHLRTVVLVLCVFVTLLNVVIVANTVSSFNELIYDHLMRSYGAHEVDSTALRTLLHWIKSYSSIRFVVQQVAWLMYFWHVYIAYLLHEWICRHRFLWGPIRHFKRNLLLILMLSTLACLGCITGGNKYHLQVQAAIITACISLESAFYLRVAGCLYRDRRSHALLSRTLHRLLFKLLGVVGLSILIFLWSLVDLLLEARHPVVGRGFIALALLPIADMLVLGDVMINPSNRIRSSKGRSRSPLLDPFASPFPSMAELTDEKMVKLKLFTTTYNARGCTSFRGLLTGFDLWIPKGYDLYAIALQQACPQLVQEIKQALTNILGADGTPFDIFQWPPLSMESSSDSRHHHLLICARSRDIQAGLIRVMTPPLPTPTSPGDDVSSISPRATGVAVDVSGTTVGFVSLLLGRRLDHENRNKLIQRLLSDLRLFENGNSADDFMQCHHVVLMGSLNYQINLAKDRLMQQVASSCKKEQDWWCSLEGKGYYFDHRWRSYSYRRMFHLRDMLSLLPPIALSAPAVISKRQVSQGSETSSHPVESEGVELIRTGSLGTAFEVDDFMVGMSEGEEEEEEVVAGGGHSEKKEEEGDDMPSWDVRPELQVGYDQRSHHYGMDQIPVVRDSQAMARWSWVGKHDSLTHAMKAKAVLTGFYEMPILFPPTYKWRRGPDAVVDSSTVRGLVEAHVPGEVGTPSADASPSASSSVTTAAAATVMQAAAGLGMRRPSTSSSLGDLEDGEPKTVLKACSYSDRILLRSISPEAERHMCLLRYDMCDALTGSHNRPVSATFEVKVRLHDSSALTPLAAAAPGVAAPHLNTTNAASTEPLMVCHVNISNLHFSTPSPLLFGSLPFFHSVRQAVGHFTVYYPLPSEDPFASERGGVTPRPMPRSSSQNTLHKVLSQASLNRGLPRRPSTSSTSDLTILEAALPATSLRRREYTFSVASINPQPTPSVGSDPRARAPRDSTKAGFTFESLVCPRTSRHALIRLWDTDGVECGQGVFLLAPPPPLPASDAHGLPENREVMVELVQGSKAMGRVTFQLEVSTAHPTPEQQMVQQPSPPHLQQLPPLGFKRKAVSCVT